MQVKELTQLEAKNDDSVLVNAEKNVESLMQERIRLYEHVKGQRTEIKAL